MGTLLNRDTRFASMRRTVQVEIADPSCTVILKELSVSQLATLDNDIPKQLALMIVDEAGERIYTTEEDIRNLREMSAAMSTRLMVEAARLNGISQAALDESIKNLLAVPNGDSVSG